MLTQLSFNVIVGSIIRGGIAALAGYLASKSILPDGSREEWVTAVTLMICTYGYSWLEKWWEARQAAKKTSLLIATAIQMPPTATVADVHAAVADSQAQP
jgi:hypothetical protein